MARTKKTARHHGKERSEKDKKKDRKYAKKYMKETRKSDKKERKPHRYRAGTAAEREIRRLTGDSCKNGKDATRLLTQRAPMERLMRELVDEHSWCDGMRVCPSSVEAFRTAAEYLCTGLFKRTLQITENGNRKTIAVKDFRIAVDSILGEHYAMKAPRHTKQVRVSGKKPYNPPAKAPRKPKEIKEIKQVSEDASDETERTGVEPPTETEDTAV
jgi:histone H3